MPTWLNPRAILAYSLAWDNQHYGSITAAEKGIKAELRHVAHTSQETRCVRSTEIISKYWNAVRSAKSWSTVRLKLRATHGPLPAP